MHNRTLCAPRTLRHFDCASKGLVCAFVRSSNKSFWVENLADKVKRVKGDCLSAVVNLFGKKCAQRVAAVDACLNLLP
jgi:hypothetical protein